MHGFDKALQQLNRGLRAVGLAHLSSLIQGKPGHPNDCIVQRAFRPADLSCSVGVSHITFHEEKIARRLADAWGDINGYDRLSCNSDAKVPYYLVEMPQALQQMIRTFDHFYYIEGIDFTAVEEADMTAWCEWLTDDRLQSIMSVWAAEQERRAFVGV